MVIELLWTDTCSVWIKTKVKDDVTKLTKYQEQKILDDVPCRISFSSIAPASLSGKGYEATQKVKLFLSNEVVIPKGSKVIVNRGGTLFVYMASGAPAIYSQHQELELELSREWT